jgi:UDP-N-acetylmuramoyl-tripeptide--D-alanyl-D-alanine ligase
VDEDAAVAALARVPSPPGRLAVRQVGGLTLVDDTYNANPGSFAAALAALSEARLPGRLIVVAGEMLELGEASAALHHAAGRQVAAAGTRLLVAVGARAADVVDGALAAGLPASAAHACASRDEAEACLRAALRPGDVVLLKGSRENVVPWLGFNFSASRICFPDGHIFKIIGDAGPGGANSPGYGDNDFVDVANYFPAKDPRLR